MTDQQRSAPDDLDEAKELRLAKLFDLRTFIGALFVIFGVLVTIAGAGASQADIRKADGLHLSLWTGLVMLVVGILFVVWMLTNPPELPGREQGEDLGDAPTAGGE